MKKCAESGKPLYENMLNKLKYSDQEVISNTYSKLYPLHKSFDNDDEEFIHTLGEVLELESEDTKKFLCNKESPDSLNAFKLNYKKLRILNEKRKLLNYDNYNELAQKLLICTDYELCELEKEQLKYELQKVRAENKFLKKRSSDGGLFEYVCLGLFSVFMAALIGSASNNHS